jgi:hypothetical protein
MGSSSKCNNLIDELRRKEREWALESTCKTTHVITGLSDVLTNTVASYLDSYDDALVYIGT